VIMRALDRSPTKRFLTVRQFVDEVSRIARGESDPKSTQPMGKPGRPKAELVQTLLGVRSGMGGYVPVPGVPAAPVVPQVAAPVVPQAAAPSQPVGTATSIGFSGGFGEGGLQAPAMQAPVAVAAPSAVGVPPHERSPWASPGAVPSMPAPAAPAPMAGAHAAIAAAAPELGKVAPPVIAAPVVAAPIVAAPVVAPPVIAAPVIAAPVVAAPAGRKRAGGEDGGSKGKFRETMWFKKGDLDAQAAVAAADERAKTGKDAGADKADSLPIDERYKDDGSISRGDKEKYSLRTGGTQMMSTVGHDKGGSESMTKVSEDALIGEMKGGRGKIFAAIGIGLAVVIAIIVFIAS